MTIPEKITLDVEAIGFIRSCYREKFGIPRQSGLVDCATARIKFFPAFAREEMFRELETFSHIWVHFLFHDVLAEGWRTTTRPPWLGGQRRVGVYASRSPHRPNHLGLSVVKLLRVLPADKGTILEVAGGDFLDRTPVVDIKPYVPFCDSVPEALSGYSGQQTDPLIVQFSQEAAAFCRQYQRQTGRELQVIIEQVLGQDPRPASQRNKDKIFGVQLWNVNIRWTVHHDLVQVTECQLITESP
ncbi:MAG: tRNA (N6-threonylcarbamoyladenosine(37)-N6)-methyltransferase TrmO [Desulfocapsaceae bacterium]|nr:tRNA (N6-threonylcarbamoyladenosine(37)-N6)-methyltransferase TrmO [Desulfocapsaceae bacterium]